MTYKDVSNNSATMSDRDTISGQLAPRFTEKLTPPPAERFKSSAGVIEEQFLKLSQAYFGMEDKIAVATAKNRNHTLTLTLDLSGSSLPEAKQAEIMDSIHRDMIMGRVSADNVLKSPSSFSIDVADRGVTADFLSDVAAKAAGQQGLKKITDLMDKTQTDLAALLGKEEGGRIMDEIKRGLVKKIEPNRPLTAIEKAASGDWDRIPSAMQQAMSR